ncbi:MAG: hypothetical protein ABWX96_08675 [Propionibacteriaceae bacterium]
MPKRSVVAVYGVPAGHVHPRRLGGGQLRMEQAVQLDREVEEALNSDEPPEILRVGIASMLDGEPFVEVIEVRQVLRSADHDPGHWAVELRTPAQSPTVLETQVDDDGGIKNLVCYLYPDFSFC